MTGNLRWKLVTAIGVLVLFAAVGVYPILASQFGISEPTFLIAKQLKLGLDLQGGDPTRGRERGTNTDFRARRPARRHPGPSWSEGLTTGQEGTRSILQAMAVSDLPPRTAGRSTRRSLDNHRAPGRAGIVANVRVTTIPPRP